MRKEIKVGDKVYRVCHCNNIFRIKEKEIVGILGGNNFIFNSQISIDNQIKGFYNKDEDVFVVEDRFYYRTKKKAVQKEIKEIELFIKGIRANLLEYKKSLKKLKELNKMDKEND
jgi:hypothetical protein